MKVIYKKGEKLVCDTPRSAIPVGTVFSGSIGQYDSKIFLRTYDKIVDLENPGLQWSADSVSFGTVENYRELRAELTVYEE
jgi:hypothetical protein